MDDPDDAPDRRAAVAEAGHRGDVATARAALADPDPAVRATALGALRRAAALDAPTLEAARSDPSPVVRRRVAEEVAASGSVAVSLLDLLDDPDPTVVEVAAWACGERVPAEPGAVTRLASLATGHDDALVREAAVAALGAIGDPAGLPAILAATGDKATALHRALDDRDWQVRQAAEDQLR